jgi:hypothetical protein
MAIESTFCLLLLRSTRRLYGLNRIEVAARVATAPSNSRRDVRETKASYVVAYLSGGVDGETRPCSMICYTDLCFAAAGTCSSATAGTERRENTSKTLHDPDTTEAIPKDNVCSTSRGDSVQAIPSGLP